jgi:tetratricopeptide (TPR) repeat protein
MDSSWQEQQIAAEADAGFDEVASALDQAIDEAIEADDLAVEVDLDAEEFAEEEISQPSAPLSDDPAERLLQAMNDFRLAQEALQRSDLGEAEAYALRAVEGDPGNGDHIALLAWIRAKEASTDQVVASLFQLSQVLEEEPTLLRARLYRGRLHKRMESWLEALRDFEAVLEVNPRHREAASEVKFLRVRLQG